MSSSCYETGNVTRYKKLPAKTFLLLLALLIVFSGTVYSSLLSFVDSSLTQSLLSSEVLLQPRVITYDENITSMPMVHNRTVEGLKNPTKEETRIPQHDDNSLTTRIPQHDDNSLTTYMSLLSSEVLLQPRVITYDENITSMPMVHNRTVEGLKNPTKKETRIPQHDDNSLTTYMWHRGEPFSALEAKRPGDASSLTIDAISIGSKYNVEQMKGQARSWASHWSVRYLFGATEQDDADPQCHEKVTAADFNDFFKFCDAKNYTYQPVKPFRTWQFPNLKWLQEQGKAVGWLCAQQRFAHAVGKVGRFYRKEGKLPHFLVIQDDQTWYGMNQMVSYLATRNNSTPFVSAGCKMLLRLNIEDFTFPSGGFGMVLNQVAIARLIKPIYCNNQTTTDVHMRKVCLQLEENVVGEKMAFQDGMSISDLMDRHAAMLPYRNYRDWKSDHGYCMLGDWVLGYYVNFYDLGSPSMNPSTPLGEIYQMGKGSCRNSGLSHCRGSSSKYVCHRIEADDMMTLHRYDATKASKVKGLAIDSSTTPQVADPHDFSMIQAREIGDKQDIHNDASCRILITQKNFDYHYETLESVALRYPLPWDNLGCQKSGLSSTDPILVDYLLSFAFLREHINEDMDGWGWKTYFEQHLQGRVRNRTDGRLIQFRSIVGITAEQLGQVDWKGYAATIEASCDATPRESWMWMRSGKSMFCVLHSTYPTPLHLAPRTCFLNPQHHPQCWYLPTDFPSFPPPKRPSTDSILRVCLPPLDQKDPTPVVQALGQLRPKNVDIVFHGRKARVPNKFKEAGLSNYTVSKNDLQDYLAFQQSISQCHVIIPMLDPASEKGYFLGKSTLNRGRLSGYVAQAIGNRIPSVLHSAVVKIYRNKLTAEYFEYNTTDDGSSFTDAFQRMLKSFGRELG